MPNLPTSNKIQLLERVSKKVPDSSCCTTFLMGDFNFDPENSRVYFDNQQSVELGSVLLDDVQVCVAEDVLVCDLVEFCFLVRVKEVHEELLGPLELWFAPLSEVARPRHLRLPL